MPPTERTLIVGIDYSDFCIPALDHGLRIAASSTSIRLVPVLALPPATASRASTAVSTTGEFVERAKDNLVRLVQDRARAITVRPPLKLVPEVCFGDAADCLLDQARKLDAELILVGTHARQGLEHLLMGSVAEAVVRRAPCSVLVARAAAPQAHAAATPSPAAERTSSGETFSTERAQSAPSGDAGTTQVISEPHLDAGRVVLHVLDVPSGQTFVCSFTDFTSVSVEPLERDWVPAPSSVQRARVARTALEEVRREPAAFEELFEELARRARPAPPAA